MSIRTSCPACGAQISVEESGGKVTCPYCSTRFDVDMDGVQPAFKVADSAAEAAPEGQIISPEVPPDYYSSSNEPSGPPLTGEVVQPVVEAVQQVGSFARRWLWIIVVVTVGVFCVSCACMAVIIQRVIK